jgi:hypothetical protein
MEKYDNGGFVQPCSLDGINPQPGYRRVIWLRQISRRELARATGLPSSMIVRRISVGTVSA